MRRTLNGRLTAGAEPFGAQRDDPSDTRKRFTGSGIAERANRSPGTSDKRRGRQETSRSRICLQQRATEVRCPHTMRDSVDANADTGQRELCHHQQSGKSLARPEDCFYAAIACVPAEGRGTASGDTTRGQACPARSREEIAQSRDR